MEMKLQKILVVCLLASGLGACQTPGPAERAGQRVDAVTGNQNRGAQRAGRNVDDAVDDLRKAGKDLRK